jgi:hypothetical protein
MENEPKFYYAPKGKIYIHKTLKIYNAGEIVEDSEEYPIKDFELIDLEEFLKLRDIEIKKNKNLENSEEL